MSDINRVVMTGRMGGDLELRYTPKGTPVGDVNVAVTSGYGEHEKTNWIGCTFWGKSAEAARQYLGKGRKIVIEGRLDQDEWTDKETGQSRRKTRVIVENWTFADSTKDRGHAEPAAASPARAPMNPENPSDADDEIPF